MGGAEELRTEGRGILQGKFMPGKGAIHLEMPLGRLSKVHSFSEKAEVIRFLSLLRNLQLSLPLNFH